jgi:hypothetical protein
LPWRWGMTTTIGARSMMLLPALLPETEVRLANWRARSEPYGRGGYRMSAVAATNAPLTLEKGRPGGKADYQWPRIPASVISGPRPTDGLKAHRPETRATACATWDCGAAGVFSTVP